ncbi:hypothetical protein GMOD_00000849 [Pyrenophora seminiperda CCB06]|uniref:Uncharacterized protein n=1 Tax=Pyrenophora seminiperda CCB06 TaxID=1302712 RepID=A0A3M7M8D2_9PLEO|nr:hypothetical protein GMOD_00000849 [Pyrenophora seminiperda CCB06]
MSHENGKTLSRLICGRGMKRAGNCAQCFLVQTPHCYSFLSGVFWKVHVAFDKIDTQSLSTYI